MNSLVISIIFLVACINIYGQEVLRGPYLQSLSPKSIKILWRTDSITNAVVWYGNTPDNLDGKMTVDKLGKDHIVELSQLNPSTRYYYAVGFEQSILVGGDSLHRFTTSPPNNSEVPIKFWTIGDFGSKRQTQIDVRDAFFENTNLEEVDFWLWLGDNAYNDGTDEEYQEKVFSDDFGYNSLLPFLPFYPVPGNHDYKSVNRSAAPKKHDGTYFDIVEVPTQGEAGGRASNTELYYSFDYGNAHFVALNSEALGYTFFKNSKMLKWLECDLQETDKKWKIVFWHQPPYSKGSHDSDHIFEIYMTAMRTNLNPIIEKYGVDLVLCGHSHVYERSYLINGHYGKTRTFDAEKHIIQGGSGNFEKGEPYIKKGKANNGTIYAVVGNSGKDTGRPKFGHPVFAFEHGGKGACGSLVVDIYKNRLDAKYIQSDSKIGDQFTIIKE